jgi:ankyrin repeat protein
MDRYGRTPLHYAAADGNEVEVRQLLSSGANPNDQDDNGWAPLHFAAQAVSGGVTKVLLEAGADTELEDSFGNTPLWRAAMNSKGDGTVIVLLRQAGANPYANNKSGSSPVAVARTIANFDVSQFFSDLPAIESD